jgi:aldose 1-epimerase
MQNAIDVVYDEPGHAVCVEPQSGPPDGPNLEPVMVPANGVLQRWMRLSVVEPASAVTVQ